MFDFIVPQDLNIQDRLGKFTFPQLGFLAGGFLIVMLMSITSSIPMWVTIVVGIPLMMMCLYLAFFKKYNMPMYEYLIVLVSYQALPKIMIYSAVEKEDDYIDYEETFNDEMIIL